MFGKVSPSSSRQFSSRFSFDQSGVTYLSLFLLLFFLTGFKLEIVNLIWRSFRKGEKLFSYHVGSLFDSEGQHPVREQVERASHGGDRQSASLSRDRHFLDGRVTPRHVPRMDRKRKQGDHRSIVFSIKTEY
jgi:hypothetical protein